jgi:hypothetical protein
LFCLIAAEESIAGLIGNNLKRINNFSEWTFEICTDAARLTDWSERGVDVLVLSRSLPGGDPINLLSQVRSSFPAAHIVLLVGQLTESGRSYMKAAEGSGLRNTVVGKLPGVRPYNLMVALTRPKNPELDAGLGQ